MALNPPSPAPFYDARETRAAEEREAALAKALPQQIAHAQANAPGWAEVLRGISAAEITSPAALARIPLTRKSDLIAFQAARPPLAGLNATSPAGLARLFMSPGPLFEAEGRRIDPWRYARALYATGLRAGELVHNCFAYHFTPAGFMVEGGARALGCPVFPGGTGNTELQARAAAHLRPHCYAGTPEFLKSILERGDALGLDLSSLKLGHVSGGAYLPALRDWYSARGLVVLQSYGTAELGLIAYETTAREGLVVDEDVILEIVLPGTGEVLPVGEVGEVVVTTLDPDYPMIRLATGDLSAELPGISPCGRTNRRIRGWMGRADQAAKVRGLFVRPEQIAEVARAVPATGRLRLVVALDGERDVMTLRAECASPDPALHAALERALQSTTKLRGTVELVPPGSLPNDGKVIDDTRPAP
jgi:phenylacetate-CoA ligase